jgi:DNA-binding MarR family transcriptional regulator
VNGDEDNGPDDAARGDADSDAAGNGDDEFAGMSPVEVGMWFLAWRYRMETFTEWVFAIALELNLAEHDIRLLVELAHRETRLDSPPPPTVEQLASEYKRSKQTMSDDLKRLERLGFVAVKAPAGGDRRTRITRVTSAGHVALTAMFVGQPPPD